MCGVSDLGMMLKTNSFVGCSLCGEECVMNINLVGFGWLEGGNKHSLLITAGTGYEENRQLLVVFLTVSLNANLN